MLQERYMSTPGEAQCLKPNSMCSLEMVEYLIPNIPFTILDLVFFENAPVFFLKSILAVVFM